jgi:signal transduction histidine kinase
MYGQFAITRSRPVLVLGSGYVFCAFMAIAHALSFPGLFAPAGVIGGGPQTTAWLYFLWHGIFPLFVIAYALLEGDGQTVHQLPGRPPTMILLAIAGTFLLALLLTLLTTVGHDSMPAIMTGNLDTSRKVYVAAGTWALSAAALVVLWRRRRPTVLDLWLMVVMCVWIFDVALAAVLNHGRFDVGWYGGRVYGLLATSFVLTVLLVEHGVLQARLIAAREAERREFLRAEQKAAELLAANRDLEAFSYSVSHDLRAPLRSIDGFSRVLQEDHAKQLGEAGIDCTTRIRRAAQRMAELIDDLLNLAKVSRANLQRVDFDLSVLARDVADTLRAGAPDRPADFVIADKMPTTGDLGLMRIVLDNLLGNAWKFTGGRSPATIEVGRRLIDGQPTYYVRDNGAGFDMAHAGKLFHAFNRLHDAREFPGTGIGLAIVHRIIAKHGGRIWAEAERGQGATFYFTLSAPALATGELRLAA